MSVFSAPVQAGGASVLAASLAKTGGVAVAKSGGALAATGANFIRSLALIGVTALGVGRLLVHRGRGTTLGAPRFD